MVAYLGAIATVRESLVILTELDGAYQLDRIGRDGGEGKGM